MHMPLHILQILCVMLSKQHRQNIPFQIGPFHLLLVLFVHPVYGGPLCYLAQDSSQFLSLHRLQYIVHTVLLDCLSGKSKVAVTAQNHEISLRNLLGAYHIQQFQPAHDRHLDIRYDQVYLMILQILQRLPAISGCGRNLESFPAPIDQDCQSLHNERFIVNK